MVPSDLNPMRSQSRQIEKYTFFRFNSNFSRMNSTFFRINSNFLYYEFDFFQIQLEFCHNEFHFFGNIKFELNLQKSNSIRIPNFSEKNEFYSVKFELNLKKFEFIVKKIEFILKKCEFILQKFEFNQKKVYLVPSDRRNSPIRSE